MNIIPVYLYDVVTLRNARYVDRLLPGRAGLRVIRCSGSRTSWEALRRAVGVPESAGGGGLRADASLFDVSVEVVAADAPFLADLVGLESAASDPVADGLFLDLEAGGDVFDR